MKPDWTWTRSWTGAAGLAVVLALARPAEAGTVVAMGYDLLTTDASQTVFAGVNWEGVPLGSHDFGGTIGTQAVGTTDTIVRRLDAASVPAMPGVSEIPIEMVALELRSVAPVDLGAGSDFHYITLQSARGGPATVGRMAIGFEVEGSPHGTFSSFFDVFFDVRLGAVDGPIILSDMLPLTNAGTPWGHEAPPGALLLQGVNFLLNGQNPEADFWPIGLIQEQHPAGAQHGAGSTTHPVVPEGHVVWALLPAGVAGWWHLRGRRRRLPA